MTHFHYFIYWTINTMIDRDVFWNFFIVSAPVLKEHIIFFLSYSTYEFIAWVQDLFLFLFCLLLT